MMTSPFAFFSSGNSGVPPRENESGDEDDSHESQTAASILRDLEGGQFMDRTSTQQAALFKVTLAEARARAEELANASESWHRRHQLVSGTCIEGDDFVGPSRFVPFLYKFRRICKKYKKFDWEDAIKEGKYIRKRC